jgi:hypothetical protein
MDLTLFAVMLVALNEPTEAREITGDVAFVPSASSRGGQGDSLERVAIVAFDFNGSVV